MVSCRCLSILHRNCREPNSLDTVLATSMSTLVALALSVDQVRDWTSRERFELLVRFVMFCVVVVALSKT